MAVNKNWPYAGDRGRISKKITSNTTEQVLIPGYADAVADIYCLIIANTSASACKVTIKDSDEAGATQLVFEVPATDTRGFTLPRKDAIQQTNPNKPWTVTCGTSLDSIEVTALFTKNS